MLMDFMPICEQEPFSKWSFTGVTMFWTLFAGSVHEMIQNWDDGYFQIFRFSPDSKDASLFKRSKIFAYMVNLPKSNKTPASYLNNAVDTCPFVKSPISIFLDLPLKRLTSIVVKHIGAPNMDFIQQYTQLAWLFGQKE